MKRNAEDGENAEEDAEKEYFGFLAATFCGTSAFFAFRFGKVG